MMYVGGKFISGLAAKGFFEEMRVTYKSIAILMALVFSLMASGPAFSAACVSHMMPGKAAMGSMQHTGHQKHQPVKDVIIPCLHHGEQAMDPVGMMDRDIQCDCLSAPPATAELRFNDLKLIVLASNSSVAPVFDNLPAIALELFERYRMQQGPPLLVTTAYQAHLARTTRQLT